MTAHRILLADDEAHITHLVAKRLATLGYTVMVARDGEEAWQIAQESPPDLVVTDLQMPYMNGLDLSSQLRGYAPTRTVPIILLTARSYIVPEDDLERSAVTEILSKPFSVRRLVERIEALLEGETTSQEEGAGPAAVRDAA